MYYLINTRTNKMVYDDKKIEDVRSVHAYCYASSTDYAVMSEGQAQQYLQLCAHAEQQRYQDIAITEWLTS